MQLDWIRCAFNAHQRYVHSIRIQTESSVKGPLEFEKIGSTKTKLSLEFVSYHFILESIYLPFYFYKMHFVFSYSYLKSFLTQTKPSSSLMILHPFYLQTSLNPFIKVLSVMIYRISSNRGPGLYFVDEIFDPASKRGRPLNEGRLYLPIATSRTESNQLYSLILAVHACNAFV